MTQPSDATDQRTPTLFGETRAQWEAHLARMHGEAWVQAQRGFLDAEWAHLLERWGGQRDPDAPPPPDANANLTV